MTRIGVMHLTDTLDAGGAERMAVNLANHLPPARYQATLCTTRRDGPLAELVGEHVERLRLERRRTFDRHAVRQLVRFIHQREVRILHAHGSALLIANWAAALVPGVRIVWHDHFGTNAARERPVWIYRLLTRRVAAVVAVSEPLARWSRDRLRVPAGRVWQLPNFVAPVAPSPASVELPGTPAARVVCVANLRPVKDQLTLLEAFAAVVRRVPAAHLLLVGAATDAAWRESIERTIRERQLAAHVSLLGPRRDVEAILRACAVGVLASTSEGLPMALLEYGTAGLPVVATRVGQCADVLDDGRAGIVVAPRAPHELADALIGLLTSPDQRQRLGTALQHRVAARYSPEAVLSQLDRIYDGILNAARVSIPT